MPQEAHWPSIEYSTGRRRVIEAIYRSLQQGVITGGRGKRSSYIDHFPSWTTTWKFLILHKQDPA